jgi:hypothetical protein
MMAYGGEDIEIHIFFALALAGEEWSASRPGRFTPGTHWIGGWVGPRACLDEVKKRKVMILPATVSRILIQAAQQDFARIHVTMPRVAAKMRNKGRLNTISERYRSTNPSKKNAYGCAANRKGQRLISTPTYYAARNFHSPVHNSRH